jgi:hypothetical protein
MTVLAGWSAALAVLVWLDAVNLAWWGALGVAVGLLTPADRLYVGLAVVLSLGLAAAMRPRRRFTKRAALEASWRFWQETGILLSAGLTFWQAVETAAASEPLVAPALSKAANGIAAGRPDTAMLEEMLEDEGQVAALLLEHGYRNGITNEQVLAHARHLRRRLIYEAEAKRRRDPLWLTVLPAILLVNVLWIFVAPMLALAGHGWLKL